MTDAAPLIEHPPASKGRTSESASRGRSGEPTTETADFRNKICHKRTFAQATPGLIRQQRAADDQHHFSSRALLFDYRQLYQKASCTVYLRSAWLSDLGS